MKHGKQPPYQVKRRRDVGSPDKNAALEEWVLWILVKLYFDRAATYERRRRIRHAGYHNDEIDLIFNAMERLDPHGRMRATAAWLQ